MTACTLMSWWVIISQRVAVRIHIPIQRLWSDHLAVDDERGAERLDARAGLGISQGGRDDRPRGGDDRAIGRDGIADEGRLAVIGVPPGLPQGQAPLSGLPGEEGGPLGPVVDVVGRLGTQMVC
jgi:hypothetical protein